MEATLNLPLQSQRVLHIVENLLKIEGFLVGMQTMARISCDSQTAGDLLRSIAELKGDVRVAITKAIEIGNDEEARLKEEAAKRHTTAALQNSAGG